MAIEISKPNRIGIVKVERSRRGGYCVLSAETVKGYPNLVHYVVYDKGTRIETFEWETAVEDFKRKAVAA